MKLHLSDVNHNTDEDGMNDAAIARSEAAISNAINREIQKARNSLPVQPPDFDGFCTECGEDIDPRRLNFGAVTCLDCQEILEHRQRHHRSQR